MRPLLYSTIELWKSPRADLPRAVLRGHHPEREKDERDPRGSGTHERSCSTTALMALDPRDLTDSRSLGILSFHGLCYWWPAEMGCRFKQYWRQGSLQVTGRYAYFWLYLKQVAERISAWLLQDFTCHEAANKLEANTQGLCLVSFYYENRHSWKSYVIQNQWSDNLVPSEFTVPIYEINNPL